MSDVDYRSILDNDSAAPIAVGNAHANPEQAAKSLRLSKQSGIPAEIVDVDPTQIEMTAKVDQIEKSLRNPSIEKYVQFSSMASKVSNDDYSTLEKIDNMIAGNKFSVHDFHQRLLDRFKRGFGWDEKPYIGISQEEQKRFTDTLALPPGAALPLQLFAQPLDLATRLPFAAAGLAAVTAGEFYEKFGGDPNWRNRFENEVENFIKWRMLGINKTGSPGVHAPKPEGALTVGEALFPAKPSPYVSVEEFLSIVRGKATRDQIDEFLSSREQKDKPLLALPPPDSPVGAHPVSDALHVEQAKLDGAGLDRLVETVEESKTRERSPEMFERFVDAAAPDDTVSIPADKVQELYSKGVPQAGDGILGFVPDLPAKLERALATGGDIQIPLSQYLAHVPKELHEKIKDFVRTGSGLTREEAKEVEKGIDAFHGSLSTDVAVQSGMHLGTADAANKRLDDLMEFEPESRPLNVPKEPRPNVTRYKLDVGKTLRLPDLGEWWPGEMAHEFVSQKIMTPEEFAELEKNDFDFDPYEYLKSKGYDSITYKNGHEDPGKDSYIVINPDKVSTAVKAAATEPPKQLSAPFDALETTRDTIAQEKRALVNGPLFEDLLPTEQTIGVKPKTNIKKVTDVLGASLYGDPGQIPVVTIKETLQNSYDAIKPLLDNKSLEKGKIDIEVDVKNRTISVIDNGTGMTPAVLGGEFIELGGSKKETDRSSGSFGFAKMLVLMENKELTVISLRDGLISSLITTGDEIKTALSNPSMELPLETREPTAADLKLFPDGHGTAMYVTIPESYQTTEGEIKPINLSEYEWNYESLNKSPLFGNIDVTFNGSKLPIGSQFKYDDYTVLNTVKLKGVGEATVYVSKKTPVTSYRNLTVLSNGIYQFAQKLAKNPRDPYSEAIDRVFYIDIHPTAKAGQSGYPFSPNRQGFSPATKDDFEKVLTYIQRLFNAVDLSTESRSFGNVSYLKQDSHGKVYSTAPEKLEPPIPEKATPATMISEGDVIEVRDGRMFVKGREIPELTKSDLAKDYINLDELMIDQEKVDPQSVIIHSNVEVKTSSKEKPDSELSPYQKLLKQSPEKPGYSTDRETTKESQWTDIVEAAREKFPGRFDEFMHGLGSIFITLRDSVADTLDYSELKKEAIGVSFGKEYRGVSIKVPFAGMFINPAVPVYTDPIKAALGVIGTAIHELAHFKIRNHGAEFPAEMQKIQIILDEMELIIDEQLKSAGGSVSLFELKKEAVRLYKDNDDIFKWLNKHFEDPKNFRASGKRFKDSEYQGRNDGTTGSVGSEGSPYGASAQTIGTGDRGPGDVDGAEGAGKPKKPQYLDPLFAGGKPLGMTQAEFNRYSKNIKRSQEEADDTAISAAEREIKRRLSPEWKAEADRLRDEVINDLRYDPTFMADRYFRTGDIPGDILAKGIKIGEEFAEGYDLGKWATKKGGVDPQELVDVFGFKSVDEMLKNLSELESQRAASGQTPAKFLQKLTEGEVARRVEDKLGKLDENVRAEAREAAVAGVQFDLMADEIKALQMQIEGKETITRDMMKAHAEADFDTMKISDAAKYDNFVRQTGTNGRQAEIGWQKGAPEDALLWRQRQFLSMTQLKLSRELAKDLGRAKKAWKRFTENKSIANIDQAYTDQIHRVLEQIGISTARNPAELAEALEGKSLEKFATDLQASGYETAFPQWLVDGQERTFKDLTTKEFYDIKDSIDNLIHLGRGVKEIDILGKKQNFEDFKAEVIDNISKLPLIPEMPTRMQKVARYFYSWDAMLTKMEEIAKDLDLRQELGPLYNALIEPAMQAKFKENTLIKNLQKRLGEFSTVFDNKWQGTLSDKIAQDFFIDPTTETPFNLSRGNLINIALNWGTESNKDKFVRGWGGDNYAEMLKGGIQDLFDKNLTKKDWEFVEAIWKLFEPWKVESDAMYRRLSGVAPDSVERIPVSTPFGEIQGNYFPIIYSDFFSNTLVRKDSPLEQNYFRATTPRGYTHTRTSLAEPIEFRNSIEMVASRMQQVMHDIAYREAVINIGKVIYDKDIRAAIRQHYGVDYEKQLTPWLEDMANHYNFAEKELSTLNSLLHRVRMNLMVHALGLNLKVIGSPDMGQWNPVQTFSYLMNRKDNVSEAMEKSKELPFTMKNLDRDFREKLDDFVAKEGISGFEEKAVRWAFTPMQKFSQGFRHLTWRKYFSDAIDRGRPEDEAIAIADSHVREQHGAAGLPDLPAIMRGSESVKLATLFYSYFNSMYNWSRQIPGDIRRGEYKEAIQNFYGTWLIGAVFGALLFNQRKEDDSYFKTVMKALALQGTGFLPFIREGANLFIEGQDPRTPIATLLKAAAQIGTDAVRAYEGKRVKKPIQHAANIVGLATGLPLGQIGRTSQFLSDVAQGEQTPEDITEWARGIIHGEARLRNK